MDGRPRRCAFITQDVSFLPQFLDYKGNSSPARTITLDPDEGNTNAEHAWAKQNNSTATKVTNSDDITRSHVTPPDESHEHMYKDAIFRIGKM